CDQGIVNPEMSCRRIGGLDASAHGGGEARLPAGGSGWAGSAAQGVQVVHGGLIGFVVQSTPFVDGIKKGEAQVGGVEGEAVAFQMGVQEFPVILFCRVQQDRAERPDFRIIYPLGHMNGLPLSMNPVFVAEQKLTGGKSTRKLEGLQMYTSASIQIARSSFNEVASSPGTLAQK